MRDRILEYMDLISTIMTKNIRLILTLFFVSGMLTGRSQDEKSKITVEITKEVNGEKRTFKGEYENAEQMRSDPNYQEFAGEDGGLKLWFDQDGTDTDLLLNLDQFNQFGKSFKFGFGGSGLDGFDLFRHFGIDSTDESSGFFHLDGDDWEEREESLDKLQEEMRSLMDHLGEGEDSRVFMFSTKRLKILDVEGDEFGKKGSVSENNLLELDNLSFFPNPSTDGRFKIRFSVPKEDELNIKVFNIEGKEVFNRYFERFGGLYSETLDLSGQKEGMYLLEISQSKQRLTKKIMITK